jgi:putative endonuclease
MGLWDSYTSRRRPVKLVWSQVFPEIRFAIHAERMIKGWTRSKKEALMEGNFDLLHELSMSSKKKKKLKMI